MSQWGKPRNIDGVTLQSHVDTGVFEPARRDSVIDEIVAIRSRDVPYEKAMEVWKWARDRYLNQPYSMWEDEMPSVPEVHGTRFTMSTDEIEDRLRPLLLEGEATGTFVEFNWVADGWPYLEVTLTAEGL